MYRYSITKSRKRPLSEDDEHEEDIKSEEEKEGSEESTTADEVDESGMSEDDEDSDEAVDAEYKHIKLAKDGDPWRRIIRLVKEGFRKKLLKAEERFKAKGETDENARVKAYNKFLPEMQERLRERYKNTLMWFNYFLKDAIHQNVMETVDTMRNEEGMDFSEALEAAIEKRKFLINRVMGRKYPDEEEESEEEEQQSEEQQSEEEEKQSEEEEQSEEEKISE